METSRSARGSQIRMGDGREPTVIGASRSQDDVIAKLNLIVTRYTELQAQDALPAAVTQEIHDALTTIEQRLREPGTGGTPRPPTDAPIMESIRRIMALMDGAAEGTTPAAAEPTQPNPDQEVVPAGRHPAGEVSEAVERMAPPAETVPVPISPSLMATVEGIYGTRRWYPNGDGAPQFDYVSRDGSGRITLTFARQPEATDGVTALWEAVKSLNTETVDILLLLVSRLAELPDPRKDTVYMRLEEIAEARGVSVREGSSGKLHDDFREQILRLADLRLSIQWTNLVDDDTIDFARDRPAHLLSIVDYTRRRQGTTWRAFEFSCGPALACFMRQDDLRLVGEYSKALLRLSPHNDSVTKRVGTFYSFVGTGAAKAGVAITVTARALLKFIGLEPDLEHPGRTVDAVVRAHNRLHEINILAQPSDWEPPARGKGFFDDWLDEPRSVFLSTMLIPQLRGEGASLPSLPQPAADVTCPADPADLCARPELIRAFCKKYGILLQELAVAVGVTPSSITRYSQGKRPLPPAIATQIHALWRTKERAREG